MCNYKIYRIDDRIGSIKELHVQLIIRGKNGFTAQFGAKVTASVARGFLFVDQIDWDIFNESIGLNDQIDFHKKKFGFYPESVHTDKIYGTRKGLRYYKKW